MGAEKNYDTEDFVNGCRERNVTPMWRRTPMSTTPRPARRRSAKSRIDGRTTRHDGYWVSQVTRKLIETLFGDGKQHGATIRQVKLRGLAKVGDVFALSMLAVDLRRLPKLFEVQATMAGGG